MQDDKIIRNTLLLQVLLLFPFLMLCLFVWPSSDDYAMGFMISDSGRNSFYVIKELYLSWGGRYSTLLGALLSPLVAIHIWLYRIILMITLLFLMLSLYAFWSQILISKRQISLALSLAFLLMWLQVMPGIADTFYWYSGVVVYTWPLVLFFFMAGAILQYPASCWKVLLPAFMITGFNEMAAALILGLSVVHVLVGSDKRRFYLLGVVSIGVLLLLLSPGNAQRMQLFSLSGTLHEAFRISLVSLLKLNGINLQNISMWMIALILLKDLNYENFHPRLHIFIRMHPAVIILTGQMFLLGLFFIPAWSMGINPPLRVYNFLTPLWLIWIFWILASIRQRWSLSGWPVFAGKGFMAMVLLIVLSLMVHFVKVPGGELVIGGNIPRAWYDLLVTAPKYDRAMHQREDIISRVRATGKNHVAVPALENPPHSIFFIDMTTNPDHWINILYARHYGVEKIETE
jgi:hypothetical protein